VYGAQTGIANRSKSSEKGQPVRESSNDMPSCKQTKHLRLILTPCPHYAGGICHGGFTLKTHQTFSVHNTPEKFENATITGQFGFEVDGDSG